MIDNTIAIDNNGPFTNTNTNYAASKILTSIRKKSVKLTIPYQGSGNISSTTGASGSSSSPYNTNAIVNRGYYGWIWSNYHYGNQTTGQIAAFGRFVTVTGEGFVDVYTRPQIANNNFPIVAGIPIRCLAE